MSPDPIELFDDARRAGLSPTKAARWAAYVLRFGYDRLSLDEAVRQVQEATR